VEKGTAVGILGVNGSGKSTLLTCIASVFSKQGDICVGYVPQENPLFDELKPVDNIKMWSPLNSSSIIEKLGAPPLSDMGITEFLDTPVKNMSGGMKKRVSLASVLINQPNLLLLDEPFAALDLPAKEDILSYMKTFLQTNGAIIVASHDEEIFDFCNKVYLLKNGELIDTDQLREKGIRYIDILRS